MSTEIINILDYLCKKIGFTIDWTAENVAPKIQELCQHYLQYEIATSIAWLVCGILFIVFAIILFVKGSKTEDEDCKIACYLFAGVLIISGFVVVAIQLTDIFRCIYFPEMQIYKYIERLISTMK